MDRVGMWAGFRMGLQVQPGPTHSVRLWSSPTNSTVQLMGSCHPTCREFSQIYIFGRGWGVVAVLIVMALEAVTKLLPLPHCQISRALGQMAWARC